MNIFVLDVGPMQCARFHCDKHVVKMIIEYAQLLSTAHRLLDGEATTVQVTSDSGKTRNKKIWVLPGEHFEVVDGRVVSDQPFCMASHINHPCAVWTRETALNYHWLSSLWNWLCHEYEHRYGREHVTKTKLFRHLNHHPRNIPYAEQTPFPLAMPDQYKVEDAVTSYQNYYVGDKTRFAKWTNRRPPGWFIERNPEHDEAYFSRTRRVVEGTTESR